MKKVRFKQKTFKVTVWNTGISKSISLRDDELSEEQDLNIFYFAKKAREVFADDELPRGYFSIYKVNLRELDMIRNKGRERLRTDKALREALEEISSWSPFENSPQPCIYLWSEQTAQGHASPENLPVDNTVKKAEEEDTKSETSRSSCSSQCKMRDNNTCVFCGYYREDGSGLEAAHLLEIETFNSIKSPEEKNNLLRSLRLYCVNEILNLLTLCKQWISYPHRPTHAKSDRLRQYTWPEKLV